MATITLKRTNCNHPDFQALIRELDGDLRASNGAETQDFFDQFNIIRDIDTVVLAYCDDAAVACGCFKPFSMGSVEAKRMFVKPGYRGQGIAHAILGELEQWARELGYTYMVLETGTRLQNAITLYKKHGYLQIENWGQYIGVAESVCMGKSLVMSHESGVVSCRS